MKFLHQQQSMNCSQATSVGQFNVELKVQPLRVRLSNSTMTFQTILVVTYRNIE